MTASSWVKTACTIETWTICNDFTSSLSPLSLARTHTAPLHAADSPTAIDGNYVVVLNEYLSDDDGMPTTHNTVFCRQRINYTGAKDVINYLFACTVLVW